MIHTSRIVYKVVRKLQDKYYSAKVSGPVTIRSGCTKEFSLEYAQGVFTVPLIPNSLLFCFDNKENARRWGGGGLEAIFEAEALGVQKITQAAYYHMDIEAFWEAARMGKLDSVMFGITSLPTGSLGAKAIKLLRQVTVSHAYSEWGDEY